MGRTYFHILKDLDYELGGVQLGTADASSDSANLYDSERTELNGNHFDRGRIYITSAGGTAPEGEVKEIQSSGNTKGQYLPTSAFSDDIEAGDEYEIVPGTYQLSELKRSVNRLLAGLMVPEEDTTSLTFDQDTKRYSLPATIPDPDYLLQVHLCPDTSPFDWVEHQGWSVTESNKLMLEHVKTPSTYHSKPIRLVYKSTPAELSAMTDSLHKKIHPDVVIFGAAKKIIFTHLRRAGEDPSTDDRYIHFAQQESKALKHMARLPSKPFPTTGFGI